MARDHMIYDLGGADVAKHADHGSVQEVDLSGRVCSLRLHCLQGSSGM